MKKEKITIDGVDYIPADLIKILAKDIKGMKYVIVRTYSAGVFAGYLEKLWTENGVKSAIIKNARRLWYWKGAASLSQLAMEGVKAPDECKFPCEVISTELTQVIEILDCTEEAQKSIASVKVWKQ